MDEYKCKDLYLLKAALEAFDLLLMENSIGKEPREHFETNYREGPRRVMGIDE